MAESLPIPYKTPYHLKEYWEQMTRSTYWKIYANNPQYRKEAQALDLHVQKKIKGEADMIPTNLTHTYFGNAILMTILTLPA